MLITKGAAVSVLCSVSPITIGSGSASSLIRCLLSYLIHAHCLFYVTSETSDCLPACLPAYSYQWDERACVLEVYVFCSCCSVSRVMCRFCSILQLESQKLSAKVLMVLHLRMCVYVYACVRARARII